MPPTPSGSVMIGMMVVSVACLLAMLDMAMLMGVPVGLSDVMRRCGGRKSAKSY
jgi:hypothetical protein